MKYYNLTMVDEMAGGDKEFTREMVQTFVEELPEDVEAMQEAVDNENAPLAYQIAHKMKPNLLLFGLDLSAEIKKMEEWSSKNFNRQEIKTYVNRIALQVLNATSALKQDFNL